MPITKKVEVLNTFKGKPDTVLTRVEKLIKTVMDVSTTHGIDAGLLYHSVADVNPKEGIVVVHDDVRGTVQTVRAMEKQYVKTTREMALKYDVHQQIMESIAAQSPEIAVSAEFIALKRRIDKDVTEKQRIIKEMFNEDTDSLIGECKAFEEFANPETKTNDTFGLGEETTTAKPKGPAAKQDFGDTFVTITDGDVSVEVLAQEYWNSIQSRLDMVEQLRTCLTK